MGKPEGLECFPGARDTDWGALEAAIWVAGAAWARVSGVSQPAARVSSQTGA